MLELRAPILRLLTASPDEKTHRRVAASPKRARLRVEAKRGCFEKKRGGNAASRRKLLCPGDKKDRFVNYRAFDSQLLYLQFSTVLPPRGRTPGKYRA